jgi:peroxisomal coenzyme A diphosphatase NUDT7
VDETPFEIARREAFEEIGLPKDDAKIPYPFKIEHICMLPCSLARTALVVRPCVAFLRSVHDERGKESDEGPLDHRIKSKELTVEEGLIPRLDAREVAAVFSASFKAFLRDKDGGTGNVGEPSSREGDTAEGPKSKKRKATLGEWYDGHWALWHDTRWRVHNFYVPVSNQKVAKPETNGLLEANEESGKVADLAASEPATVVRYKVWGMTARLLVDAARIAYAEEPEFEV